MTAPVREVVHATPRTRIIRIDLRGVPFTFAAGQAVMVGLHGSPLRKPYSIASAPSETARTGVLELLLQVDDGGALDPHLERAEAGTMLDVEGPFGHFGPGNPMTSVPVLFVAGGTGIAPLRAILVERLATGVASPMALIHSARSAQELAYRDEFVALAGGGSLRAYFTVTGDADAAWTGPWGRIDKALLETALPSASAVCIACGPPQFVTDVREWLRGLNIPPEHFLTQLT